MNINNYIKIENLIGFGSSRAVYKAEGKVIKINLTKLGYLQSRTECWFYEIASSQLNVVLLLNKIESLNKIYSISKFLEPISKEEFDISCSDMFSDGNYLEEEDALVELASKLGICTDDWYSSTNRALLNNKLVLIDYGMKVKFYELLEVDNCSNLTREQIHNRVLSILKKEEV